MINSYKEVYSYIYKNICLIVVTVIYSIKVLKVLKLAT